MNVELLRKIQKHILAEPERFAMSWWCGTGDPGKPLLDDSFGESNIDALIAPECGTVACIAGWAVLLSDGKDGIYSSRYIQERAWELLGEKAERRLFHTCKWPGKFANRYEKAKTRKGKAQAAASRIDHFIKTKGAE